MDRPRLLVLTAVTAERDAVRRGLGLSGVVVSATGVGVAAAAANAARALTTAALTGDPFDIVVSAGIAGGFAGRAELGATLLATHSVAADLGAATPTGFQSVTELGFGRSVYPSDPVLLAAMRAILPEAALGQVLTVTTVTGSTDRADELIRRHPRAVGEAMEGFGVASAAALSGVAFIEIRTVSNLVGPRDRSQWDIPRALAALEHATARLADLPRPALAGQISGGDE